MSRTKLLDDTVALIFGDLSGMMFSGHHRGEQKSKSPEWFRMFLWKFETYLLGLCAYFQHGNAWYETLFANLRYLLKQTLSHNIVDQYAYIIK